MFLISVQRSARVFGLAILANLLLLAAAAQEPDRCFVETPTYDSHGNRIPIKVVRITLEGQAHPDLLTEAPTLGVNTRGETIYFPARLIGRRRLEVTIKNKDGSTMIRTIPLLACRQRMSLRSGVSDTGADVSYSTLTGRIVGCRLSSDWWIRVMPMFGNQEAAIIPDGYVDPEDGHFEIPSSWTGERYVLVIGAGKDTLGTKDIDVTAGRDQDIGPVDVTHSCPGGSREMKAPK